MEPALAVETWRGPAIETRHEVAGAVVHRDGRLRLAFGSNRRFPTRSTVKILQALPLVRSGAADALALSRSRLALACGSHSGQAGHTRRLSRWLEDLGLSAEDLACPPWPSPRASRLRHNCSGKHCGWLSVARHLGGRTEEYLDAQGPVQLEALGAVGEACGVELGPDRLAGDGCGGPSPLLSMTELARGLAGVLAAPVDSAEQRLLLAMAAHPWLIGGTGRFDTLVSRATAGNCVTKEGADGLQVAMVRNQGWAVAVKALSGSGWAARTAIVAVLGRLGVVDVESLAAGPGQLGQAANANVLDDSGRPVGRVVVQLPDLG